MLQTMSDALADAVAVIRVGDVDELGRLLAAHSDLATAFLGPRSLLHVATDWPGHFPRVGDTIRVLVEAGAEVDVRFVGDHSETPLHWAASSGDLEAVDTLLDLTADIEADGGVIGGGTPLADAVAFGQWEAARRLVERGARVNLWQAAALGMLQEVESLVRDESPDPDDLANALWCACHGGQRATAEYLITHGADTSWEGHDGLTARGAAERAGVAELAAWLAESGAR